MNDLHCPRHLSLHTSGPYRRRPAEWVATVACGLLLALLLGAAIVIGGR